MRKKLLLFVMIALLYPGCTIPENNNSIEVWKNEIIEAERLFAEMAKDEGIPVAFLAFAADNAVLLRSNNLIIGKDAIRERLEGSSSNNEVSLTWTPDYVDVSSSGDMAYTYGPYTLIVTDSLGNVTEDKGYFHTVWKRQTDGTWKYVWD